jgi:hypothetical protein
MINFTCPRCNTPYAYSDDMAGTKIRCAGPNCNQKLLIPAPAAPMPVPAPAAPNRPSECLWNYEAHGRQNGPVPLADLMRLAADGRLSRDNRVWSTGMTDWRPAGEALPELFRKPVAARPAKPAAKAGGAGDGSRGILFEKLGVGVFAIVAAAILVGLFAAFMTAVRNSQADDDDESPKQAKRHAKQTKPPEPKTQPLQAVQAKPRPQRRSRSKPSTTVRVNETVEIDDKGDGKFTREYLLPLREYTVFRDTTTNNTALLQRRFQLSRRWQEIQDFKARFEDAGSTLVLEWTTRGLARLGKSGLWEAAVAEEGELELTQVGTEGVLTGLIATDSWGKAPLTRRVLLPDSSTELQLLRSAGKVGYRLPPPPNKAGGKVELSFVLEARPHLMACLGQVYGNPRFPEWWTARTVVQNTGNQPLTDCLVRLRLPGYTAKWTEFTCPLVVPGQTLVDGYFPILDLKKLTELTASCQVSLEVEYQYRQADGRLIQKSESKAIKVLSRNLAIFSSLPREEQLGFHDGLNNIPFVLAAIVTKDDRVIEELAGRVSRRAGGANAADDDNDAFKFMKVLYEFMSAHIAYQTPPVELFDGKETQHIKYGRDVLRNRAGTCIDLAIIYASVCQAVGLEPVLFVIQGHCFPAVRLPHSKGLVGVEATWIGKHPFQAACAEGKKKIDATSNSRDYYAVDVSSLQNSGVRGLPLVPQALSLKDLGISDNDRPQPQQPQPRPNASGSLVGKWRCTMAGVDWTLLLRADGRFAWLMILDSQGQKKRQANVGTFRVQGQNLVFTSQGKGDTIWPYQLNGNNLTLTMRLDEGKTFQFQFTRGN